MQINAYGPNAAVIRASHFDYSSETRDFALVVCDNTALPLFVTANLNAPSTNDGWVVQGSLPAYRVTDSMYFLVSNITARTIFFNAVPYSGPEIVDVAGPQPWDTVSNTISFVATVRDLSGVTNTTVVPQVDGLTRWTLAANNTIHLETRYAPNGYRIFTLQALNTSARIYDQTNRPMDARLAFESYTNMTLDFENDVCLISASDNSQSEIGTNHILFSVNSPQTLVATITDTNGQPLFRQTNVVTAPETVDVAWDFSTYGADTYQLNFVSLPTNNPPFMLTNHIERTGVRFGQGVWLTYQWDDPSDPQFGQLNQYINSRAAQKIGGDLATAYSTLYSFLGYSTVDIGTNRNFGDCHQMDSWGGYWETQLSYLTNMIRDANNNPTTTARYSDITLTHVHGNGYEMGHSTNDSYMPGAFNTSDLFVLLNRVSTPSTRNWRIRKAALWSCYSGD